MVVELRNPKLTPKKEKSVYKVYSKGVVSLAVRLFILSTE